MTVQAKFALLFGLSIFLFTAAFWMIKLDLFTFQILAPAYAVAGGLGLIAAAIASRQ